MIDPILDHRLSRRRRWKHLIWFVARIFVLPLLLLLIRLRGYGLGNVPRRGGAILIANHVDFFDPILIEAMSPRPVFWMTKAEAFQYPVLRWFARQAGAFPVERGKPDRSALRHAQKLLDEGMIVGIFPEGTRTRTGGLKEPHAGVSLVAVRGNVPIIPCALVGTEDLPIAAYKPPHRRRYPEVSILFGEPFRLEPRKPEGGRWSLNELTDALMIELARLLPERYRGLYAERAREPHPAIRRDDLRFTGLGD